MAANKRGRAKVLPEDDKQGFIKEGPQSKKPKITAPVSGAAEYVLGLWETWAQERIEKEEAWVNCEKAYLSQHQTPDDMAKWKSKAFIPASYNAAENIHAQLMSGLFPHSQDFFEVEEPDEGFEARSSAVKELLKQQLEQSAFRPAFSQFVKQLVVIGNSAAMVDWYEDEKRNKHCSRFIPLDMNYFHVDPFSSDPNTGNKMRRYWMTEEEAESSGIFDSDALEELDNISSTEGAPSGMEDANRMTEAQAAGMTTGIDPERGGIELTELWGTFEVNGQCYENYVITVGNGVVLRFSPSPYEHGTDPFVFARYTIIPGEAYGIGALEPALPLQFLINTFTNQKVDELSLIINGMWKFMDDGVLDTDELVVEPGMMIEVGDMNNVESVAPSSSVAVAYTEIADLERKFEDATGALKLVVGGAAPQGDRTTATQIMAQTQSGNTRFNETLAHIEETSLKPALYKYLSNAKQFMTKKVSVKILGEDDKKDWAEITSDDINGDYALRLNGSTLVGVREMRLRNLIQYGQIIGGIQPLAQRFDWEKFNAKIWREFGFDSDENMLKEAPVEPPAAAAPQQGAAPQGAAPQGAAPQGAAPQGAAPQGASPAASQIEQMMAGMSGVPGQQGGQGG